MSGVLLIEQRLGLLQIERVEASGEPAVDRSEQFAGLIPLVLIVWRPQSNSLMRDGQLANAARFVWKQCV